MSDSDSLNFDSMRAERTQRSDSIVSRGSVQHQDEDMADIDSVNLLDPNDNRENLNSTGREDVSVSGDTIRKEVRRSLEPLMHQMKMLKMQVEGMDKKMTTVVHQNEGLQKQLKEIRSEFSKGADDLPALLTGEGLQFLKLMCFRNLDMAARDEDETTLFGKFWAKAKEEGWLIKTSGKAEKDILQRYREKRNYLKAQVRVRMLEDMSNKTPYQAAKLEKTSRFVRDHIGVAELPEDCSKILYNLAYTMVKYLNKNADVASFDEAEKGIKKKAEKNVWNYVMERVERDRKAKRDTAAVKQRFVRILESGVTFEPC